METKIRYKTKIIYSTVPMDLSDKGAGISSCLSYLNAAINKFLENLEEFNDPKVSVDFCSWWDGVTLNFGPGISRGYPRDNDCVAVATITYKVKVAI